MTPEAVYQRLARLCSTKECCPADLRRKMATWEVDASVQERVLAQLVAERYVDEERYARAFVRDKFRYNRWGRQRIRQELQQRQIAEPLIAEALEEIPAEDAQETLGALLRAKLRSVKGKNDYEIFMKVLRYGVGRGFSVDETHRCLEQILRTDADEGL